MMAKKVKMRKPNVCPNCGQDREPWPLPDDVSPYSYESNDFPHENLVDCIKFLKQQLEGVCRRLDEHRL